MVTAEFIKAILDRMGAKAEDAAVEEMRKLSDAFTQEVVKDAKHIAHTDKRDTITANDVVEAAQHEQEMQ